jgi:hypothetical protein
MVVACVFRFGASLRKNTGRWMISGEIKVRIES